MIGPPSISGPTLALRSKMQFLICTQSVPPKLPMPSTGTRDRYHVVWNSIICVSTLCPVALTSAGNERPRRVIRTLIAVYLLVSWVCIMFRVCVGLSLNASVSPPNAHARELTPFALETPPHFVSWGRRCIQNRWLSITRKTTSSAPPVCSTAKLSLSLALSISSSTDK